MLLSDYPKIRICDICGEIIDDDPNVLRYMEISTQGIPMYSYHLHKECIVGGSILKTMEFLTLSELKKSL